MIDAFGLNRNKFRRSEWTAAAKLRAFHFAAQKAVSAPLKIE